MRASMRTMAARDSNAGRKTSGLVTGVARECAGGVAAHRRRSVDNRGPPPANHGGAAGGVPRCRCLSTNNARAPRFHAP
jgi:hypothetical protein